MNIYYIDNSPFSAWPLPENVCAFLYSVSGLKRQIGISVILNNSGKYIPGKKIL